MHYNHFIMETAMKHAIWVLVGVMLAACAARPPSSATDPLDKLAEIQARGTIVIATDADYVPQSQLIPGSEADPNTKCEPTQYTASQFQGFDVEVARELANRLGVEPCFVTPPWSQLVAGNWGDNWDVHVGSVAITFDRMQHLYFTQPYYATPTVLLVHKENETYSTPEDLSGKKIGVCAGCTFEAYLKGTLKIPGEELEYRIQNAQIVAFENEDPAIMALSLGDGVELDAVMTILPKAHAAIEAGLPVKILDEPILFAYASITLDRSSDSDSYRLFTAVNQIIQELHKQNTLQELSSTYQGSDLTREAASYNIDSLNQFP
jgi:polar amino acid transport system substrate-binding protein